MSEKAGPELDAKLAELMGLGRNVRLSGSTERVRIYDPNPFYSDGSVTALDVRRAGPKPYSTDVAAAISAAEELRKAGRIDAWDIHQFETSSASTGRLNGRTMVWSDAVQGDPDSADPRAHALTLALVAALSAEPVESMKGGRA
jgi:hypothetical protein